MLPSCGHFKNIHCPFYKLALCVRPHCPYKHQNSENDHSRQLFTPLVDETESLLDSNLGKTAYQDDTSDIIIESATYIPTPVDSNSKPQGILKTSSSLERPSTSYVPEYKPTPISKLSSGSNSSSATVTKSTKSQYSPEYPVAVRKKKNVEEYDPTEVKFVHKKKSVTFVDQPETSDDTDDVVLISSDEDDCESAPKFSDDDYEEPSPSIPSATQKVPEITIIKEEVVDDTKIDEFSVVDKILVDCKKNEMLLNSHQKLKLSKTNSLPSKSIAVQKQDKSKLAVPQKSEIGTVKSSTNGVTVKLEKDTSVAKGEDGKISISKVKKSDDQRSVGKSDKDKSKDKKVSSSNSSNSKEKSSLSKDGDKVKHSKKMSHDTKKSTSSDSKVSKSDKHSATESSEQSKSKKRSDNHHAKPSASNSTLHKNESSEQSKSKKRTDDHHAKPSDSGSILNKNGSLEQVKSKKRTENHHAKPSDSDSSLNKKKSKTGSVHSQKSSESNSKFLENNSSATHSIKRKSDITDSDSEHHSVKNKSSSHAKKIKLDSNNSSSKRKKSIDSVSSDRSKTGSESYSDIDLAMLKDLSSSDEEDLDEECRRIFNECYPESSMSPHKRDNVEEPPRSSKDPELVILRKKRFAHPAAAEFKPPTKQAKPEVKRLLNPAQVMHNRFAQFKAQYSQLNQNKDMSKGTDKKRISFAPNQSLLAAVMNKNQGNPALGDFSPLPPTVSKSLKVTKRTAHIPETAMKPRPIIPAEYGCKVPANIRQKYLNAFIDECLKFCDSEDEAYDEALEEEKKAYERSSSRSLYLNVAANALKRLRRRAEEGPQAAGNNTVSSKSNVSKSGTVSHEIVLNGPLAQRTSFSVGRKKEIPEIKGAAALYEYLLQYVLTPEQLVENSYPRPHPTEKDKAVIAGAYANRTLYCNDAFKRTCSRCHKTYYVNVDGDYVRDEECDFHWGRIWKKRIAGSFESRYSCCQGDAESDGCCVSAGHVFEGSEAHVLKGYVKTLPKTPPPDNCYGIYALDCEMCYTAAGMELTRITVVDTDLKPVYESFVKPQNKVLDYNTRFSGITEDDLKNVRTSIHDVQAVLLCIFNDKTILIGHSLESDFKALKLFHSTVIDTSVVFPHKSGLPFKRALRTLMAENLNKIIQNDVGGHDSMEDAVACMELMLWKVKEDVRSNR